MTAETSRTAPADGGGAAVDESPSTWTSPTKPTKVVPGPAKAPARCDARCTGDGGGGGGERGQEAEVGKGRTETELEMTH